MSKTDDSDSIKSNLIAAVEDAWSLLEDPPEPIIDNLIDAGEVINIVSPPGGAKTALLVRMLRELSLGLPVLGRLEATPVPSLFWAGEARKSTGRRLRLASQLLKGEPLASCHLLREGDIDLKNGGVDTAIAVIRELEARLVVLDTASAFGSGDEQPGAMDGFSRGVSRLRDETGASIIVIHHTSLMDKTRGRGSTKMQGMVERESVITKHEEVADLDGGPWFTLSIPSKNRDNPTGFIGGFFIEGKYAGKNTKGVGYHLPWVVPASNDQHEKLRTHLSKGKVTPEMTAEIEAALDAGGTKRSVAEKLGLTEYQVQKVMQARKERGVGR